MVFVGNSRPVHVMSIIVIMDNSGDGVLRTPKGLRRGFKTFIDWTDILTCPLNHDSYQLSMPLNLRSPIHRSSEYAEVSLVDLLMRNT